MHTLLIATFVVAVAGFVCSTAWWLKLLPSPKGYDEGWTMSAQMGAFATGAGLYLTTNELLQLTGAVIMFTAFGLNGVRNKQLFLRISGIIWLVIALAGLGLLIYELLR